MGDVVDVPWRPMPTGPVAAPAAGEPVYKRNGFLQVMVTVMGG